MIVKNGKPSTQYVVISGNSILQWTAESTRRRAESTFCHHRFENKWKYWYAQGYRIKKAKVTIEIL